MSRLFFDFIARHPRAALLVAVLYLLVPVDLFPEALFGLAGYLDDLVILILAIVPRMLKNRARDAGPDRGTTD